MRVDVSPRCTPNVIIVWHNDLEDGDVTLASRTRTLVQRRVPAWPVAGVMVLAGATGCTTATGVQGVSKITVTPANVAVVVHDHATLHASLLDASGQLVNGPSVFWSSEDSTIAVVSASGVVTAMSAGVVRIAASAEGASATATVTVSAVRVASIVVVPDTLRLGPGASSRLLATAYNGSGIAVSGLALTWGSGSPAVATVDQTGVVTAVAAGTSTVTALAGGQTGSAAVIVATPTVASLTIVPDTLSVAPGAVGQLKVTAFDAAGHVLSGLPVTWGSSNNAVATVDTVGNVTGVANGTAQVSAAVAGHTATATVIVGNLPPVTIAGCNGGTLNETTAAPIIVTGNIDNGCAATLKSTAGSIELQGTIDHQSTATLVAMSGVALDQQIRGGSVVQATAGKAFTLAHDVNGMPGDTAWTLTVFDCDSLTIGGNVHGGARTQLHSHGPILITGMIHDPGTDVVWWAPSFQAQGGIDPASVVVKQNWGGFPDLY